MHFVYVEVRWYMCLNCDVKVRGSNRPEWAGAHDPRICTSSAVQLEYVYERGNVLGKRSNELL